MTGAEMQAPFFEGPWEVCSHKYFKPYQYLARS